MPESRSASPSDYLAAERTFLAWIRTGLALMGFGFVVARFGLFLREIAMTTHTHSIESTGGSLWIGTAAFAGGSRRQCRRVDQSRWLNQKAQPRRGYRASVLRRDRSSSHPGSPRIRAGRVPPADEIGAASSLRRPMIYRGSFCPV